MADRIVKEYEVDKLVERLKTVRPETMANLVVILAVNLCRLRDDRLDPAAIPDGSVVDVVGSIMEPMYKMELANQALKKLTKKLINNARGH
jgi:hypothetical protein